MRRYILKNKGLLVITITCRVIAALMNVFIAILLQRIVDSATTGKMNVFIKLAVFSIFYFLILSVFEYLTETTQAMYLKKTINKIRKDIFKGILKKDYKDFKENNTGEYISNLTNDINLIENDYILPILMLTGDVVIFVSTTAILLSINVWVTLALFLTVILMLIVPAVFSKIVAKRQSDLSDNLSLFTKAVKDIFLGQEIIKSYSLEKHIDDEFDNENNKLSNYKFKSVHMKAITDSVISFLAVGCQTSGLIISGFFVLTGNLTVGSLVAIIQLGNGINGPVMWIVQKITQLKGMKEVNEKIISIINTNNKSNELVNINEINNNIKLEDVMFSYNSDKKVLNGVNLLLEKNKKYAIVGESGCGKSTLAKLLLGYYNNYEGSIKIDNTEIKNINHESLSKLLTIIHQDIFMFDKSIKENITLWNDFDDKDIEKSLDISGINKFINKFPNGLDYLVGENGKNLSGGEKQRIAIARSIIQNTPVLIIDEGTSSLDNKTAYDIEEKLLDQTDLTIITITHKINKEVLKKYDYIIVMDKGKIIDMDKYDNLISKKSEFCDLIVNV